MAILVLLIVYTLVAVGFSLADPIFEPPDEHLHFAYVRYLVEHRDLPRLVQGELSEYHQPPLYYVLAALAGGWLPADDLPSLAALRNPFTRFDHSDLSRNNKNLWLHGPWDTFPYHGTALAVHVIRLLTVLIGLGAVWVTYRLTSDVLGSRAAGMGAAAFVAFNPMFLLLAGAVHNEPLKVLEGGALLWASIGVMRHGLTLRRALLLGVLMGLAWLTKVTSIFLLPAIELAITWTAWRRHSLRDWLRFNLVSAATALAIAGWLSVRNLRVYGEPTAVGADLRIWGSRDLASGLAALPNELLFAWTSFWGRFGYSHLPQPGAVYMALSLVALAAVAGIARWLLQVPRHKADLVPAPAEVAVLATASLSLLAAMIGYLVFSPAGMFGRYTFPALSATATLLFFGLSQWVPRHRTGALAVICTLGMAGLSVTSLVLYVGRIYAPPPPVSASNLASIPNRLDVRFGQIARLLGYQVNADKVQPGSRVAVNVYWQVLARAPENYVVFVHLANDQGLIAAQLDTHPGLGTYPTGAWEPGRIFADTYLLEVPPTAYAPDDTHLEVGLYDLATGRRLPASGAAAEPLGDRLRLAALPVEPLPGDLPNPIQVNFDNQLELAGYQLDRRVATPGDTIRLTLYWRVLQPCDHNLETFAHVLGLNDQIWAYGDGRPRTPERNTSRWQPGSLVEDVRELRVIDGAPPEQYDLEVGWFNPHEGNHRLHIRNSDGTPGPDRVLLTHVLLAPGRADKAPE